MSQMTRGIPTKVLRIRAYRESVYLARSLMDEATEEWGISDDDCFNLRLITSELVTNAVLYFPGGQIVVTIARNPESRIRVSVWDGSEKMPLVRVTGPESEHGRGLLLVTELCGSEHCGVDRTRPTGKWVWASYGSVG